MSTKLVKVIKGRQISLSGSVRLGPGNLPFPVRTEQTPARPDSHTPASAPRQVRIVESNSEYAIIEVICSCGSKCHIQCNYADIMNEKPVTSKPPQNNQPQQKPPQQQKPKQQQKPSQQPGPDQKGPDNTEKK